MARYEHDRYRPGVGIVLLNARGQVFVGRRIRRKHIWQMPQGGIDNGETPTEAARRELREEIGTDRADVISESKGWFRYKIPAEFIPRSWQGRWDGQTQKWIVMLFRGTDSDIDIATATPEFDAWRWVDIANLPTLAERFKRQLYADVIGEFSTIFRD